MIVSYQFARMVHLDFCYCLVLLNTAHAGNPSPECYGNSRVVTVVYIPYKDTWEFNSQTDKGRNRSKLASFQSPWVKDSGDYLKLRLQMHASRRHNTRVFSPLLLHFPERKPVDSDDACVLPCKQFTFKFIECMQPCANSWFLTEDAFWVPPFHCYPLLNYYFHNLLWLVNAIFSPTELNTDWLFLLRLCWNWHRSAHCLATLASPSLHCWKREHGIPEQFFRVTNSTSSSRRFPFYVWYSGLLTKDSTTI